MTSAEKTGSRTKGGFDLSKLLGENGALLGLLVLAGALWLMVPSFGSPQNLLNIGVQAAVVAVMAFGVTFVIISGGIDLSVGSVAALSAMVGSYSAAELGLSSELALIMGLLTGVAAGLVNGMLVSFGKLPAFIATLAMLSIARGLTLVVSEGRPVATPESISFLGSTLELGSFQLPVPVIILLGMFLVTGFVLVRTYSGRAMYAIGGNEEAARLSGINVRNQKLVVYALSGLFAAMAGMMLAGRLSSAGPQAAEGYELDAIAAVVIGGASLSGGIGRATGTLVGALILAVLRNGLNQLQVSSFWQQVVIGVVIALAVLVDTLRRRGR
ncbi:ABC transporter permease [Actinoalloteichus hymeniacidonis]|uniref:Permease component of ribose/xylose/arabinose/galactoside ABC-type transporters n=1 Tax=Actinoalloteichus hymeniacidonis TaxID=340345 RepID=A0AAC9N061_9PSEU|nr:ABC transporter permease [Actinoalloteichus hymeniacidonis]AOS66163.1 permease component of ribose/xylose/arabinose/galactoside ABC-type transporters [Actinoalloteichus hymeniacidonis]MBB5905734.1 ribose transport system permease protein [Actinoalloteichus hymeniacidonis]